jgi:hypothetical protein
MTTRVIYGWYRRWFLMPWKWADLRNRRAVYRYRWEIPA